MWLVAVCRSDYTTTDVHLRWKIPEKIQVSEEDLKELTDSAKPDLDVDPKLEEGAEDSEVSLDEISETESQVTEANSEDTDTSNN